MHEESKFWLGVMGLIALTIGGIVLGTSSYYKALDQRVVDIVRLGHSPIAAVCAMTATGSVASPECLVYITGAINDK